MKPRSWIIPVLAVLAVMWTAADVSAATANITRNPNSTAHRSTVNGQFNGIYINVSTDNMPNVTACVLNFTNNLSNDAFTVNITNGEGGATQGAGVGPTVVNRTFVNLTIGQESLNLSNRVDGNWTITGRCYNHSAAVGGNGDINTSAGGIKSWNETITETTFILDSRAPAAATGLTTVSLAEDRTNLSASITPNGTTNCTAWIRTGSRGTFAAYVMPRTTQNSSTCTLSSFFAATAGDTYEWYVEASDLTNKTNSSLSTFSIDGGGSSGALATARQAQLVEAARQAQVANVARNAQLARAAEATTQAKSSNTKIILGIAGVLALVGYTQGWFGKKKGRR